MAINTARLVDVYEDADPIGYGAELALHYVLKDLAAQLKDEADPIQALLNAANALRK